MVEYTANGIRIGAEEIPLYSATFHYWRSDVSDWRRIVEQIKGMHFEIVETYIPWSVHEEQEGHFDFGQVQPDKNLERFLSLCEEYGLYVIVRPGPHINAEMTNFGYPEWILYDKEIQAQNPWGTTVAYPYVTKQFPIPSYASSKLYEKAERYFKELLPILKRHCYPDGTIIAIQADNETCNFFRDKPYTMDYSPESVAGYRRFLHEKYETAEALGQAYGVQCEAFESVIPPSGYSQGELTKCLDWVAFKEEQILEALRRMTGNLQRLALPIPIFHNCAYQTYTPISMQRAEKIEGLSVAGIDAYPEPGDTTMLKDRVRYIAGSSRLPYIPEFGSGSWFDRLTLLTPREEEFAYLYAFMYGLKAAGYYMIVERDRWTGCPVREDGSIRADYYTMFRHMNKMAVSEEIFRYTRMPRILVLRSYEMGRLKAAMEDASPNLRSSNCFIAGPDLPQGLLASEDPAIYPIDREPLYYEEAFIREVCGKLDDFHLDYNISDCYLGSKQMSKYDLVIASIYGQEQDEYRMLLKRFHELPGKKLLTGPSEHGNDTAGWVMEDFSEWIETEYTADTPDIESAIHWERDKRNYLLYLANTAKDERQVTVHFCGHRSFRAIINGDGLEAAGNRLSFPLPGKTVSIWKIGREEETQKGGSL